MAITDPIARIQSGLSDYCLNSIGWSISGQDLVIELSAPGNNQLRLKLTFIWATDVDVNLRFENRLMGSPMLWQSSVAADETTASGYKVMFDFAGAPTGYISFSCNQVKLAEI